MRGLVLYSLLLAGSFALAEDPAAPRKIVLIAGKKSHGPGAHDYERTMRLFKVMLDNSNVADRVRVEVHENGWPADETTLDDADTIIFNSDGRDGDKFSDVPFVVGERMQVIQKQIDRGCGMMTMHFSTFVNDEQGKSVLQWIGGYFDWQDDAGKANWFSKISQIETLELAAKDHAISRGVPRMVQLRDEVYWKLRFLPEDKRRTPIWRAIDVKDEDPTASTVAWAIERADGGRGFGTSVGHSYRLWQDDGIRKLFLNAILWTAKAEIPEVGVEAKFYSDAEVKLALEGIKPDERAVVESPLRVLLFTGNKNHAWHNGEKSTPRIKSALEADSRIQVEVSSDIEDLAQAKLSDYAAIVLNNYANWQDPKGLSEPAKQAFVRYLKGGGGLVVIHFANGAFHYSLPEAGESDWPEYRKIVRRVWDHHGREGAKSGHDAFGPYTVNVTTIEHPITAGLKPFEVTDELYYHQAGSEPIEPLLTARSKDTKQDEPLAWAYQYDEARVFQTLLGHSEQTYDAYEPREMLRRAVAWAARRKVVPLPRDEEKLTAVKLPAVALAEGKFGQALDATKGGVLLATEAEQADPPLTVECWTKLNSKEGFNILVASEEKSSATHWELYSYAGSGVCSVFLPGRGGEFKSEIDIADGKWHHVGFAMDAEQLWIYVDGKLALDRAITKLDQQSGRGDLGIGRLVEGSIACAGLIDDVRISRGTIALDRLPDRPLIRDDATSLLISFDDAEELAKLQASSKNIPKPTVSVTKPNHWGVEGIGFAWKEDDSRDDRWKDMQIGRFLASSLPLGTAAGTVAKGLSIRLGDKQEATVCYDTQHCKLRAAWTGGFLKFTPARYGLIMPPLMDGEPQFLAPETPGWDAKEIQYRGMMRQGKQVELVYRVDGVFVTEKPWFQEIDSQPAFSRTIEVGHSTQPLTMRVAGVLDKSHRLEVRRLTAGDVAVLTTEGASVVFAYFGPLASEWRIVDGKELHLTIPPRKGLSTFKLCMWPCEESKLEKHYALARNARLNDVDLPYERQWTQKITTTGKVAADDAPYVVDTITLPFDNPYKALFFTSGHDFVSHDTMAVCTVHGDVWLVSRVDSKLEALSWKRFATGLFQPLGLVAKKDGIYVLGRDQITRLMDRNNDGEADVYECFTNKMPTSPGGHDYTTCLETDDAGNFYFITALQGIWRLSPDGKQLDNIAGGLRNPNGLGVGPGPIITTAPQEGNWTPASYIAEARPGDWFGFGGPKVTPERPLGWTQPLCFIPRRRDNSSGGQVWVTSDRWGPLQDQLLHFSYGQCRQMLVLREVIKGQPQGGTVDMPQLFDSGAMRGRFSPHDGQLYVSGLRGWTTAATQDGCLQRVRYTGKPAHMPLKFRTLQNGVAITFSEPLQRAAAQDVENYHLEQWNYRYAESYGSPDFKVSDPKQEGHDVVRVESATLLDDDRTVFLEIKDLQPVNQLTVGYALTAVSGEEFRHTIAYTIHNLSAERMDPTKLNRSPDGRLTEAEQELLRPGLLAKFEQGDQQDTRPLRMAALYAGPDEPPSMFLSPRPFQATLSGYLNVPLRGDFRLSLAGTGKATVEINGRQVLKAVDETASVSLRGGYNDIVVRYDSPPTGAAQLRLFWEGEGIAREPVPPTALFYRGDDGPLAESRRLRQGHALLEQRHCSACHASPALPASGRSPLAVGQLQPDWLAAFLLNPQQFQPHGKMPRVLKESDAQDAADLAAYLGIPNMAAAAPLPDGSSDEGLALYENLNCLACHRLTPPEESDAFGRVSLHFVNAKYSRQGLIEYLERGHTPAFKLSVAERASLAAYLRDANQGTLKKPAKKLAGDAFRGSDLLAKRDCLRCHTLPGDRTGNAAPRGELPLAKFDRGCLSDDAPRRGAAPEFGWRDGDKQEVVAYLRSQETAPGRVPLAEQSARLVAELRCQACHNRDGQNGARLPILDDESETGHAPEFLPDLTWAGEKLQTTWLKRLLSGDVEKPTRVWLKGRMPAYPQHADALSKGLAAEHGLAPVDQPAAAPLAELIAAGEQLTHKEHLDCLQCHGVGKLEPIGDDKTKLAPGINFALVKQRLRHDYYRRFVLDPPRFDTSTRMVKLAPDGKTTKVTSFYDGDAAQQFEAIWNYIQSVK